MNLTQEVLDYILTPVEPDDELRSVGGNVPRKIVVRGRVYRRFLNMDLLAVHIFGYANLHPVEKKKLLRALNACGWTRRTRGRVGGRGGPREMLRTVEGSPEAWFCRMIDAQEFDPEIDDLV